MGKKLLVFVLIAAILFSFSSVAYASEVPVATEDSKLVSEEIVSQIVPTGTGKVFRIYSISLRFAFAYYQNIDEILASPYLLEVFYAKKINGEYAHWRYKDNECKPANGVRVNSRAMKMLETDEVIGYIGSDVIVYNTYYLSGETSHKGSAIYYKTNQGDYVYYSHNTAGELLFPVEDFCAFQKAILQEISQNQSPDMLGDVDICQVWDLSPYDFRNLNENEPDDIDPKPDVTDPDAPEPPKEEVDDPVIPDPPKEDVDEPVIPDPPKEDVDDPVIPNPPKEDVDEPLFPDLPEEEVNDQVTLEPSEENVTEPVAPAPSEKSPVTTGEVKNSEDNNADKTRALVLAVIDACLLLAGAVAAIICWRKGMMR